MGKGGRMAGRTRRAKGRLMEAFGALADNKKTKDKGRLQQLFGSGERKGRKAKRRQPDPSSATISLAR